MKDACIYYQLLFNMSVSSLFSCSLQVIMNDVTLYEREFPYLPGNVRTQLATVMARRGILNARNMPMVLHDCVYNLDLSECNITTEELRLLWRLSSRLKKLDIGMRRGYRDTLTTPALTQLLSHLPSLHSLDLQSCLHLDHSSLLSLTSTSPYLTSLTLSGCHMVNDHCVIICSNRLKYLQALSLTKTKVSSVGLIALSKSVCAKILKELDISHCVNVCDEGILSLLSHCSSLSILVFHGCPLLTSLTRDKATSLKLKQVTWTIY